MPTSFVERHTYLILAVLGTRLPNFSSAWHPGRPRHPTLTNKTFESHRSIACRHYLSAKCLKVGDSNDPQGTQRPKENPLVDEYHILRPLNVPDRASQVNLPSDILPINAYNIFTLFFLATQFWMLLCEIPIDMHVFKRLI